MNPQDIMVVIVSYNGQNSPVVLAQELGKYVGHVHIVDNGSAPDSRRALEALRGRAGLTLDLLSENMGIAYALNRGVAQAASLGKPWLLTMDQDSRPDEGMIGAFCRAVERRPEVVCLSPRISNYGQMRPVKRLVLEYAITSGNLVHWSVYDRIGGYREPLFIDCVDLDFSLRVRAAGIKVELIPEAILHHELGGRIRGRPAVRFYTAHSGLRRYYQYRNMVYIIRRHALRFPFFVLKLVVGDGMLFLSLPVYERDWMAGYRWIFAGLRDGLLGRYGKKTAEAGLRPGEV